MHVYIQDCILNAYPQIAMRFDSAPLHLAACACANCIALPETGAALRAMYMNFGI